MRNTVFATLLLLLLTTPAAKAEYSDFLSLCNSLAKTSGPRGLTTCSRLHQLFFSSEGTAHFAPVTPRQVNAPAMSVDSKVQFLVFNDPNYVPGIAYCYVVYRRWIDPKQVSPDQLGLAAGGFAVLREDLKGYQAWLQNDPAGRQCKARVESESQVTVANLEASLKEQVALIGLNPLALIQQKNGDYAAILRELALTLNHERIHAYQVLCPEFEKWSLAQWQALPEASKSAVKRQHPDYQWQDLKVAAREHAAFLLEKKPETVLGLVGRCKL
ncbi:MAG: hypothetical protein NDJ90_13935 [Oligoflexia bacterium]|nr:hypothetical protein [Oligoflexia bacterium]